MLSAGDRQPQNRLLRHRRDQHRRQRRRFLLHPRRSHRQARADQGSQGPVGLRAPRDPRHTRHPGKRVHHRKGHHVEHISTFGPQARKRKRPFLQQRGFCQNGQSNLRRWALCSLSGQRCHRLMSVGLRAPRADRRRPFGNHHLLTSSDSNNQRYPRQRRSRQDGDPRCHQQHHRPGRSLSPLRGQRLHQQACPPACLRRCRRQGLSLRSCH